MIPNYNNRVVESEGITESQVFGISRNDEAHIMSILRDTLYSDKVLAVLREYAANAWDAHREAGKADVPIKVTLPTLMDPTLTIQDFGAGLSHNDVFQVYTQYGASTKRGSDTAVGMLGIGSKSGFAYSDSFTITSCYGGTKRVYVAVLDASEKGTVNLLYSEICGPETGVSIQIPIKPEDIGEFVEKARELYQYFSPRPDINEVLPALLEDYRILKHGVLGEDKMENGTWIAIMGCIPYRINMDQLQGAGVPDGGIGNHVFNMSGALYFNIGEVQISASREELKYSTLTKQALVAKFNALIEEYVRTTLDAIEKGSMNIWEKRIRAQVLSKLKLPVPKNCKDLTKTSVDLAVKPTKFKIGSGDGQLCVYVCRESKLILFDDTRDLSGFVRSYHEEVVYPLEGVTVEEAEKEVHEVLEKSELVGIPVIRLSSIPWTAPPKKWVKPKPPTNEKHKVNTFKLKIGATLDHPWSQAWEIEKRVPQVDDVYVILENFKVKGGGAHFTEFPSFYKQDTRMAAGLDGKMPTIYGYKTTKKKPLDKATVVGVDYFEWRKTFAKSLITPEIQKQLDNCCWDSVLNNDYTKHKAVDICVNQLGKDHPITAFAKRKYRAVKQYKKYSYDKKRTLETLSKIVYTIDNKSEATLRKLSLYQRYPLLSLPSIKLTALWDDNSEQWVNYVKIIDSILPWDKVFAKAEDIEDDEDE